MGLFEMLFSEGDHSGSRFSAVDRAQLIRLERKVDAIMQHLGITYAEVTPVTDLSLDVQELARDPSRKIMAIKLHREQTGAGLKEAKDAVEEFARRSN